MCLFSLKWNHNLARKGLYPRVWHTLKLTFKLPWARKMRSPRTVGFDLSWVWGEVHLKVILGWPRQILSKVTRFSPKAIMWPWNCHWHHAIGARQGLITHGKFTNIKPSLPPLEGSHPHIWCRNTVVFTSRRWQKMSSLRWCHCKPILRATTFDSDGVSGHTEKFSLDKWSPKPTLALPVRSAARAAAPI